MSPVSRSVLACLLIGLLMGLAGPVAVSADEATQPQAQTLKDALSQTILPAEQTLTETRRFAAARVPAVPQFETAEACEAFSETTRTAALERVVFRGAAQEWRKAWTKVERLDLIEGGPGYKIQKLRLEVLPDMWIPALLYLPDTLKGKTPVFLNVNGHDPVGKAADYKQARCIHMARHGIIALNLEWLGMGQLATGGFSHSRMNQLDLCGTSGLAPFYLSMSRAIDFLLTLENADETRVGVAGLSGGGWQTILISSLDTRVTLCNPVAGYSSFRTRIDNVSDLGDSEQTPVDLGITADYAHLTTMLAPRAALLTYNQKDNCCFASGHALEPLVQAASPVYKLLGQESRLRTHINIDPGTHNFLIDNRQALYRMIRDHWFEGNDQIFPATELPLEAELKTRELLDVPMPMPNRDFHTLALSLAESLPRSVARPTAATDLSSWRKMQTERLRAVVHPISGQVAAAEISKSVDGGVTITQWKLTIGDDWTVPATEFRRGDSTKVALVICDEGRKAAGAQVNRLLNEEFQVLAFDPFYFGEASIAERGYLWALMVSTVGERPLGVQAGQVSSIAKWIHDTKNPASLRLITEGPRTSVIGLVARALEPRLISAVEEHKPLESLKDILHANHTFDQSPELFCAGLLEVTDIPQLRELPGE